MKEEKTQNAEVVNAVEESVVATPSEVIVTEEVLEAPQKPRFYQSWKFWGFIILLIALILGVFVIINVITVYREASLYKKAYDIVQKEREYCEEISNTSQPRDNFVYCDKFKEKFKEVESK